MDPALQAHMAAMRGMGGEGQGYGLFGIPLFKDTQGFQGIEGGLATVLRGLAYGSQHGKPQLNDWLVKLLKSLGFDSKTIFDQFKSSGVSGGEAHHGPVSHGVSSSHADGLDHGHGGSGISYD